jgi:thiamine biosynthesis lipoprotein ApbE
VVGDQGTIGDPLATALFILGPEKGLTIVKKLGYEAIFVDDKGRVVMTEGIKKIENSLQH